ncbi:hypothetical protein TCAL_15454 [Tigriopus californicus]|uniref:Uncharacterized protein n=1 Tax=Tigriopus californicus TaxID=6832 RepID=A0A553PRP3_TIGCA|nr:hypothetical protein TCAL_15454 [Tigriopus californicus]
MIKSFIFPIILAVSGVEVDEDVDEDEEDPSNGVQDRILPRIWCRLKCAPICIAQPKAACVCTKTFLGIFPLFTINLPCC